MNKGTVKWFNNAKGYGFIESEGCTDIFVHYTGILSDEKYKTLKNGVEVAYDIEDRENGKTQAINVIVLK